MKLRDVLTKSRNNLNKQTIWNPKKRLLKEKGITEEQLLNMEVGNLMRRIKN